jgi:hypothetical protein
MEVMGQKDSQMKGEVLDVKFKEVKKETKLKH